MKRSGTPGGPRSPGRRGSRRPAPAAVAPTGSFAGAGRGHEHGARAPVGRPPQARLPSSGWRSGSGVSSRVSRWTSQIPRPVRLDPPPSRLAHRRAVRRQQGGGDGPGHGHRVAAVHDMARPPVQHRVGGAAGVPGDDGQAAGRRLQEDDAESLGLQAALAGAAGHREQVGGGVVVRHLGVVHAAREDDRARRAAAGQAAQPPLVRAASHDQQHRLGYDPPDVRQGAQQGVPDPCAGRGARRTARPCGSSPIPYRSRRTLRIRAARSGWNSPASTPGVSRARWACGPRAGAIRDRVYSPR